MPKWKEGSTEFTVSVGYSEKRGYACTIPRPVIEALGEPERIIFVVKRKKIEIVPAEDRQ
jgi:hypothetical protein